MENIQQGEGGGRQWNGGGGGGASASPSYVIGYDILVTQKTLSLPPAVGFCRIGLKLWYKPPVAWWASEYVKDLCLSLSKFF